ncbi:uncharacterized protein LOC118201903 [Stegodyphus dumicola]|uniref:uncharacterized protein LOC118201903 n=1 Tax=Stegodyphus dumicola TaxID=202533 RepID=UPI0015B30289|nr:uncharacterized protein LOC118201903 [Stegodyphus dumicola]
MLQNVHHINAQQNTFEVSPNTRSTSTSSSSTIPNTLPSHSNANSSTPSGVKSSAMNLDFTPALERINFIQINLQKSRAATAHAVDYAVNAKADILIVQEPSTRDGKIVGFPLRWSIYQHVNKAELPRAAIVILNPLWSPLVFKTDRDHVAILLELIDIKIILYSIYSPPTASLESALLFLEYIRQHYPVPNNIIVGDLNAHSTIWGYPQTDVSGHLLEDFLNSNNLVLHNTIDAPPTFEQASTYGWPDLTISTPPTAVYVQNWTVDYISGLSDHKYVLFQLEHTTSTSIVRRYRLPGHKIAVFRRRVTACLRNLVPHLHRCTTSTELNEFTVHLMTSIQAICNDLLPQRHTKKLQSITWWNSSLGQQQQKCRSLRRKLKQLRRLGTSDRLLEVYRRDRARYEKMILQAKLQSWRDFCTNNNHRNLWFTS